MRAQQVLLQKQAKHFPCPFSLPAPGLVGQQGTALQDCPFSTGSVASCTHLSMSPPPAQGAPVLQTPRRHGTSAGASPPRPPHREMHSKDPLKLGWHPCTDTSAEPRDKYPCDSEAFFTTGQDLPRDLMEHHVQKVKGGIVWSLI